MITLVAMPTGSASLVSAVAALTVDMGRYQTGLNPRVLNLLNHGARALMPQCSLLLKTFLSQMLTSVILSSGIWK